MVLRVVSSRVMVFMGNFFWMFGVDCVFRYGVSDGVMWLVVYCCLVVM